MNVLYILVPLAVLLAATAVGGFVWAVRKGQFDDVHTPAIRMLLDEDDVEPHEEQAPLPSNDDDPR